MVGISWKLVGGLVCHVLLFRVLGILISTDSYFFQRVETTNQEVCFFEHPWTEILIDAILEELQRSFHDMFYVFDVC